MNTKTIAHRILAGFLCFCLLVPASASVALAGKSGKKDFKEGIKYEEMQQWDIAAQKFALALSAEPNNPEYKVHYYRALQNAAQMYVKRGDTLMEQGDYASAYSAYRMAFQYDQGNEMAKRKMEMTLEQQKAQQGLSGETGKINAVGNFRPTSNDIIVASKPRSKSDALQTIKFEKSSPYKMVVNTLARGLNLNVVFDEAIKDSDTIGIELTDVTMAKAFDTVLLLKKNTFEQIDRRTVLVYPDNTANRPRFEKLMVKTFYLGNISGQTARTVLTAMLPPGRQMAEVSSGGGVGGGGGTNNSNMLLVKATPAELQLVQDILDSIDKNKNEVVLDIEIFEVAHDSMLQIGNQIATKEQQVTSTTVEYTDKETGKPVYVTRPSSSLANLGGLGANPLAGTVNLLGGALDPLRPQNFLGYGALLGLPPTTISLLQSRGNTKLLHKTQIHVLDGGQNTTKVGKSVPVRLGSQLGLGGFGGYGGGIGTGIGTGTVGGVVGGAVTGAVGGALGSNLYGGLGGLGGGYGIDSIQYRDVGLVIEAQPVITNEGYVELKMKFETSDVIASGTTSELQPSFTQRSLNTVARIQDGVTAIVAGVNQESKSDSRAGIPVLSMVPILGRLFATPKQESSQTDIIITVTPHVIRSAGINKQDYFAKNAGVVQGGITQSIEEVINRAEAEENEERRLIALQNSPGVQPGTGQGLTGPTAAPNTLAAANQMGQPVVQPTAPTAVRQQPPAVNNSSRRVLDSRSLIQTSNTVSSGSPIAEQTPPLDSPAAEVAPEANGQPQQIGQAIQGQVGQIHGGGAPGPGGPTGQAGDGNVAEAQPSVPMAVVSGTVVPERVQRRAAQLMAEARAQKEAEAAAAAANKNRKQELMATVAPPDQYMAQAPAQKVAPAIPKMNTTPRANAGVSFSLAPEQNRLQLGKSLIVAVNVAGQSQVSGANIALKFDQKKLRVKSVSDAGMFGPKPEMSYDTNGGNLVVRLKHAQNALVNATGRMILVEFEAVGEGQAEVAFNNSDVRVRLANNQQAPAAGMPTYITISRDAVTSASNER